MTDIPTLLTKLRAATGPDRNLEYALMSNLAGHPEWMIEVDGELVPNADTMSYPHYLSCPHFTSSLDAARTAVPEARRIQIIEYSNGDGRFFMVFLFERDGGRQKGVGQHASEQYAILIAAFEARLAMEADRG